MFVSNYEEQVSIIYKVEGGGAGFTSTYSLARVKDGRSGRYHLCIAKGFTPLEPKIFVRWVTEPYAALAESRMLTQSSIHSDRSYIPKIDVQNQDTGPIPADVATMPYSD